MKSYLYFGLIFIWLSIPIYGLCTSHPLHRNQAPQPTQQTSSPKTQTNAHVVPIEETIQAGLSN